VSDSADSNDSKNLTDKPFLSFLDLDMAFDRDTFVDVESGRVGVDPADFARLLAKECVNFQEVLAGGDASSGVPMVALRRVEAQPKAVAGVRHALYDTLITRFIEAYQHAGEEEGQEVGAAVGPDFDAVLHRGAYAVIRLAIITNADFIA
jgi:hypothetical protein